MAKKLHLDAEGIISLKETHSGYSCLFLSLSVKPSRVLQCEIGMDQVSGNREETGRCSHGDARGG